MLLSLKNSQVLYPSCYFLVELKCGITPLSWSTAVLQRCLGWQILFSRCKKMGFAWLRDQKCHTIMIWIDFLTENENCAEQQCVFPLIVSHIIITVKKKKKSQNHFYHIQQRYYNIFSGLSTNSTSNRQTTDNSTSKFSSWCNWPSMVEGSSVATISPWPFWFLYRKHWKQ